MSREIKDLVSANATSNEVAEMAESQGMTRMLEDGIYKILNGATTLDEVLRATR